MNELFLQKVISLLREQLDWKISKKEAMYKHVSDVLEVNEIGDMTPEEFVALYRMKFKPKFPDHPTGRVFVDGHYGQDGDMFLFITKDEP